MHIKKSTAIVLFSFLGAAIIILAGFVVKTNASLADCKQVVKASWRNSCAKLAESLVNVDYALQKCRYATSSPVAVTFAADVWKEAGTAKVCLEELPVYELNLVNTSKFFNQVGEYALSLAKKMSDGGTVTEEEAQTLETLSRTARRLAVDITDMQYTIAAENLCCDELEKYLGKSVAVAETAADGSVRMMSDNVLENTELNLDLPVLNYDGRFSDHLYALKSVLLENKSEITKQEARKRAAYVTGEKLLSFSEGTDVKFNGFDAWLFTGDGVSVTVTKRGGSICEINRDKQAGDAGVTIDDAKKAAEKFLSNLEIKNMTCVSSTSANNVATFVYCYNSDGCICYPDAIRLSVALDDGSVVSYSACDYIMSHNVSRNTIPSLTKAQAEASVSKLLSVISTQLAVIETNSFVTKEKLCWEVNCINSDGEGVTVYVNADNGKEEDIKISYLSDNDKYLK